MTSARNRRRQLVVHPGLQKKIILQTSLFPMLSLCVGCMITGLFYTRLVTEASAVEERAKSDRQLMIDVSDCVHALKDMRATERLFDTWLSGYKHHRLYYEDHMNAGQLAVTARGEDRR